MNKEEFIKNLQKLRNIRDEKLAKSLDEKWRIKFQENKFAKEWESKNVIIKETLKDEKTD